MRENKTPYVPPVKHIELDERKLKPRLILTIVFFLIALAAITYGVISMTSTEDGWRTIEVSSELSGTCTSEIAFQYNLGASGVAAGVEYRALSKVYKEAADNATKIFNNLTYVDTSNLRTLNNNPNAEIEIAPELYSALKLLSDNGRREIFYAPYYDEYNSLFLCTDDIEAYNFDPTRNEDEAQYLADVSKYINDESHVSLTFTGDNKVILNVSDSYLTFAEEYGIRSYIDLYWMKNAFIVDYIADKLVDNGYCFGSLSTFDGYVRNLDSSSGYTYGFNLYDKVDNTVNPAAIMNYSGSIAIVNYRSFPMSDLDVQYYYEDENGKITHKYIGADGYPTCSTSSLVMLSRDAGCAEILVKTMKYYLADELDTESIGNLTDIDCVYFDNGNIFTLVSDENITFDNLYDGYGVKKIS